ncbi:phosphopantetheine-binding protein [Streptomyces sp. cf386]|uniref:phosphopantetheine-binding protein n=1 Tax=Streptomyces sp. cf386 TaxID=1761904 RepID=UPI00210B0FDA|nr:phosphopantetheine-binding protein [Streptomyces sp. cf386]
MSRHFLHDAAPPTMNAWDTAEFRSLGFPALSCDGIPDARRKKMDNSIVGRVVAVLGELTLPTTDVTPDTTFDSMEIDSLLLEELALRLQKTFGIEIEMGELVPEQTIAEAAAVLASKGVTVV